MYILLFALRYHKEIDKIIYKVDEEGGFEQEKGNSNFWGKRFRQVLQILSKGVERGSFLGVPRFILLGLLVWSRVFPLHHLPFPPEIQRKY